MKTDKELRLTGDDIVALRRFQPAELIFVFQQCDESGGDACRDEEE